MCSCWMKCGLVGGSRKCGTGGGTLKFQDPKSGPMAHSSYRLLPGCRTFSSFSSTMYAYLWPCFLHWWQQTKPLTLYKAPIKCFPYEELLWSRCLLIAVEHWLSQVVNLFANVTMSYSIKKGNKNKGETEGKMLERCKNGNDVLSINKTLCLEVKMAGYVSRMGKKTLPSHQGWIGFMRHARLIC